MCRENEIQLEQNFWVWTLWMVSEESALLGKTASSSSGGKWRKRWLDKQIGVCTENRIWDWIAEKYQKCFRLSLVCAAKLSEVGLGFLVAFAFSCLSLTSQQHWRLNVDGVEKKWKDCCDCKCVACVNVGYDIQNFIAFEFQKFEAKQLGAKGVVTSLVVIHVSRKICGVLLWLACVLHIALPRYP